MFNSNLRLKSDLDSAAVSMRELSKTHCVSFNTICVSTHKDQLLKWLLFLSLWNRLFNVLVVLGDVTMISFHSLGFGDSIFVAQSLRYRLDSRYHQILICPLQFPQPGMI